MTTQAVVGLWSPIAERPKELTLAKAKAWGPPAPPGRSAKQTLTQPKLM